MTRGTPASSQIVWLEGRVAELEAKLTERDEALREAVNALTNLVIATKHLTPCPGTLEIAERAIKAAEAAQ